MPSTANITVLLLGAGGSAAANVLDALRRSGRPFRVIGADASAVKLHLSAADERVVLPRCDEPGYAGALADAVERFSVDVVHPQPDPEVLAVGRLRDDLPARTFLPTQEALELAADKAACSAALADAGVPVPESIGIDSLDEAAEVTDKLLAAYDRVWVRARRGAMARAALPVSSGDQAEAWIRWWVDERDAAASDFMAAEMLPGREFAYQSVWQGGELVAGQARERMEYLFGQHTPSGQTSSPSVARTVHEPQVDDVALAAIRAIDPEPEGVYCVDMKQDATGTPKVTEINAGRFFTTSNFFAAAGLNMPDMVMRMAMGERPERLPTSPLPADLYWIRMVDMGYALVPGAELDVWHRADR